MTILCPIFGRGVAQRRLGAEVPEFRQKFPVLLGAPVVPKAQIWNSKKNCLGPPLKNRLFSRPKIKLRGGMDYMIGKGCSHLFRAYKTYFSTPHGSPTIRHTKDQQTNKFMGIGGLSPPPNLLPKAPLVAK